MSRLPEPIDELLAQVNRARGASFRLAGRYAGGELGAAMLVDDDGAHYALKFYDAAQLPQLHYAQATAERLHEAGYPAPAYRDIGRVGEQTLRVSFANGQAAGKGVAVAEGRQVEEVTGRCMGAFHRWPTPGARSCRLCNIGRVELIHVRLSLANATLQTVRQWLR